ncbi:metallophosphoesterase [Celeribacter litoreus]|uniref:metallophosphoesterase n=1 Tax=Celeribacter litoreus TaxID=2876714 RepID=UPI001CCAAE4A|nr:metallophosphoesterase [Celeribacter litoreus]MCA0043750.1 metallophosphoesterase family protein [Celeribacter litoreus]
MRIKRYRVEHPAWGARDPLRIVIISDLHAGAPQIPLRRVRRIAAKANRLNPDLAVLLGDFSAAHRWTWGGTGKFEIIDALKHFSGRHGTFAVLGNHDWWQDFDAAKERAPCEAQTALAHHRIPLLDNEATLLRHDGGDVWLVGLADQRPFDAGPEGEGFDDLDAAMELVTSEAPAIVLAHEPDLFPNVPEQCILTLSGHTHGGQIRIGNRSPIIMASENETYSYGRYDADGRILIISGGIGCSEVPVRVNMPPEITVVTLCDVEGK